MFKFLKEKFSKIKGALAKTQAVLSGKISSLFKGPISDETFDKLEQILYEADLGSNLSMELVDLTRSFLKKNKEASIPQILSFLGQTSLEILNTPPKRVPILPQKGPEIILVVGVNGSGKTTSIAKLAHQMKQSGKSVLLAAGDTFRAAASSQLATWAKRIDIPIVQSSPGADPASVAFDAVNSAKAKGCDTVLIDTAGRLQNKTDLMNQLGKIVRVIQKIDPQAPHQTLLILDATVGQNAVDQAKTFDEFTPLSGIVLTKLDGSAKGGIALSIYKGLGIPIEWIGLGEQMDDLVPFDPNSYVDAIFKQD